MSLDVLYCKFDIRDFMMWDLTLIPSKRDKARRGLKARRVRRDLMAPNSENSRALATRLIRETYTQTTTDKNVITVGEKQGCVFFLIAVSLGKMAFPMHKWPFHSFRFCQTSSLQHQTHTVPDTLTKCTHTVYRCIATYCMW